MFFLVLVLVRVRGGAPEGPFFWGGGEWCVYIKCMDMCARIRSHI